MVKLKSKRSLPSYQERKLQEARERAARRRFDQAIKIVEQKERNKRIWFNITLAIFFVLLSAGLFAIHMIPDVSEWIKLGGAK